MCHAISLLSYNLISILMKVYTDIRTKVIFNIAFATNRYMKGISNDKAESTFYKAKTCGFRSRRQGFAVGEIYTARDQAHKRMCDTAKQSSEMPFEIKNSVIYYCGPSPAKPGDAIGSAGPTTSYRMDSFAPMLLDMGQIAMIGKGDRGKEVIEAIKRNKAVYFAAIGGAGAYMSKCVNKAKIIAYEDLGAEAIRELEVSNMPLIVAIDSKGNSLYKKF